MRDTLFLQRFILYHIMLNSKVRKALRKTLFHISGNASLPQTSASYDITALRFEFYMAELKNILFTFLGRPISRLWFISEPWNKFSDRSMVTEQIRHSSFREMFPVSIELSSKGNNNYISRIINSCRKRRRTHRTRKYNI